MRIMRSSSWEDDGSVNVTSTSSSQTRVPQAVPSHPNSRHRCKSALRFTFSDMFFGEFWVPFFVSFPVSAFWNLIVLGEDLSF